MKMSLSLLALTTVACLVVGCGGGGSTPASYLPSADASANLKVLVVENDGQTSGLDAHVFRLVQTDETAVSAADGSLAFGSAPSGSLTLRLENENTLGLGTRHGGGGEGIDPDDDEHADGAEVHVENVQAQEQVEVRVHLRNAEMACVCVSRQFRGERDVEVAMLPTDANDDPDMQGELELELNVQRQAFQVAVVAADTARELELVVIDTEGFEESQGVQVVDELGEAVWRMDTEDGDLLPFAVVDLEELEGYAVEVRDADTGDALLTATVPQLPPFAGEDRGKAGNQEQHQNGEGEDAPHNDDANHGDDAPHNDDANHGDDGHHGDGEDPGDEDPLIGRADLTALEEGLEGWVEIRSRDDGDCESFHMEATGLEQGRGVEFYIEDPDGPNGQVSWLYLDERTASAQGKVHLGLSTEQGDELPGGVDSVEDLVGLEVEIRDADTGDVLLYGTVPELAAD